MSHNQQRPRKEDENEVDEKESIKDGVDSSRDNNIDDEEIDYHDDDYFSVENIEDNQPEENHNRNDNNNNNNNDEDVDIEEDHDHDHDDDTNDVNNDEDDHDDSNFESSRDEQCPLRYAMIKTMMILISNFNNDEDDDDSNFEISKDECPLQYAISNNISIEIILAVIELFPMNVQHINKEGDYPLHFALNCGNKLIALRLMELFPEAAQHKDIEGYYPLHLAIRSHNSRHDLSEAVILKLIEIYPEAAIESTREGTALHFACNKTLSETVYTKLIELSPRAIHEKDNQGMYPIHFAIQGDRPIAVIKLLLVDNPLGMQQQNDSNETPVHVAFETNNADRVQHLMPRSDLQITIRDCHGYTPLHYAFHYACHHDRVQIVDMLLNHPDIDVNATDKWNDDTPLHVALKFNCCSELSVKIVQKLLDHPFILINSKNSDNKTPLDLIKDYLIGLEEYSIHVRPREEMIQCCRKIIHILEEFPIKKRWKVYCYYIKN